MKSKQAKVSCGLALFSYLKVDASLAAVLFTFDFDLVLDATPCASSPRTE